MPYQPGLEDDEEMGPETFADPYAAPLPPAPTPQPADVQNVGMASLAGMDPNNIDLKKVLYAQLMESSKYGDEANKLKARDAELGQQEAQQMLNNQLQDRSMQFAQALSPGAKQLKDNTTESFASKIGADQKARSALRQQLLAKAQGGQQAALSGMVKLQDQDADRALKKQQFADAEKGKYGRTRMLADATQGKIDAIPAFDKLPKDVQKRVQDINASSDKILAGLGTFDGKITELDGALKRNDKKAFLQTAESMLKYLNDPINADALAGPEAARAAPELKFQLGNMLKTGQPFGRDLPGFLTKVKTLSNVLKGTLEKNDKMAEDLKAGKKPQLERWKIDEPSMGGAGTAMGAPALKNPEDMTDAELEAEARGGQ